MKDELDDYDRAFYEAMYRTAPLRPEVGQKAEAMVKNYKVIVPAFNAESVIERTLKNIEKAGYLDSCVFIDDASTDNTAQILQCWEKKLGSVYYLQRNGQKIGSLKKVLNKMAENKTLPEYIIFCDADSFIFGKDVRQGLANAIQYLEDKKFAAIGLMDTPHDNVTFIQKCQYWEYYADRAIHNFLGPKGYMRCIPGAGGIYLAKHLMTALEFHSLRHAGDDMELTALVQSQRHKVGYYNKDIEVRTVVPSTLRKLIKQRVRWTRGAIETYIKERKFYSKRVFEGNRHSWQISYETLKILTYAGWYYAICTNPIFILVIGWVGTFALSWMLAMANSELHGKRLKMTIWMLPTALMIYIVDTIRLPISVAQVTYNLFPTLATYESWESCLIWCLRG